MLCFKLWLVSIYKLIADYHEVKTKLNYIIIPNQPGDLLFYLVTCVTWLGILFWFEYFTKMLALKYAKLNKNQYYNIIKVI